MSYRDDFPIGSRVIVNAPCGEGSDCEFNGRAGTVVAHGQWFGVKFDKPPRYWPNPTTICPHNLRAALTRAQDEDRK